MKSKFSNLQPTQSFLIFKVYVVDKTDHQIVYLCVFAYNEVLPWKLQTLKFDIQVASKK